MVPLKVQIWGLPLHCRTAKIGASIGEVMESDIFETKEKGSFIKVHVGSKTDRVSWVDFLYERIPQFCYSCGLIGHDEDGCTKRTEENNVENDAPFLGPWLRASQVGRKCATANKASDYNDRPNLNKQKQVTLPNEVLNMLSSLSVTKEPVSPYKRTVKEQLEPNKESHVPISVYPADTITEFEVLQQEHVSVISTTEETKVGDQDRGQPTTHLPLWTNLLSNATSLLLPPPPELGKDTILGTNAPPKDQTINNY
ncbi:Zinc knuckle CX2CX4HX4C [Sesbania bispinosa]|nr:Zinc knuckle CX2CX4HX4C [Sesbania bispinosa]